MGSSNQWNYTYYIQKGVSHQLAKTQCQDSITIFEDQTSIIFVLADGLGSLPYSEIAAKTATETARVFLQKHARYHISGVSEDHFLELRKNIIEELKLRIQQEAQKREIPVSKMDCTLTFAHIFKKNDLILFGRLGDSAVCLIGEDKATSYNDGNTSANGTTTVMEKDAYQNLEIHLIDAEKEKIKAIILTSDGLENEIYMKRSDHVNQIASYYVNSIINSSYLEKSQIRENAANIIRERIKKLTSAKNTPFDDDISIVVASCFDKEIQLPTDPTWLCSCGTRNQLQDTYCKNCQNDFSKIYKNVVFKEYGGKAAFFEWINQHPEKERELIGQMSSPKGEPGIPEFDSDAIHYEIDPNSIRKRPVRKRKRKIKHSLLLLSYPVVLVIGILLGSFLFSINVSDQLQSLTNEMENIRLQINDLQKEMEPTEDPPVNEANEPSGEMDMAATEYGPTEEM